MASIKTKMKFTILIIGFLLTQTALAGGIKGVDPETSKVINNLVGSLKLVKGDVQKIRGDNGQSIRVGAANQIVQEGDTLTTGENSFVRLQMIDDTVISLGANSKLKFDKMSFKSKEERQCLFDLVTGKIRANIVNKSKNNDIMVKTPTAALGVRGTIFLTTVNTNSPGELATQFAVIEGKVRVENKVNDEKINLEGKEKLLLVNSVDDSQVGLESLDVKKENIPSEEFSRLASYDDNNAEGAPVFLDDYRESGLAPVGRKVKKENSEFKESSGSSKKNWNNKLQDLNKKLDEYHGK